MEGCDESAMRDASQSQNTGTPIHIRMLPMAMTAGLTSAIMDARSPQIVDAVKAADLLLGHDEWGGAWIAAHRKRLAAAGA